MTAPRVRNPVLRAAGFGAVAAALAVAACETPGPVSVAPAAIEHVYGEGPSKLNPREVIARYYPDVLTKGAGAGATLTFVVSPGGEIVHHALERAPAAPAGVTATGSDVRVPMRIQPVFTAKDLNPDDIETVDVLRFSAGQMGPDPVGVVWIVMGETGSGGVDGRGAGIRISGGSPDAHLSITARGEGTRPRREERVPLLQRLVEKHRPRVPEGTDQLVWARFTLDARRKAQGVVIEGQPHPAVGEAARKVLEEMVFQPAQGTEEMRLGLDFAQGRGRRLETRAGPRVPATSRETITAAMLRAYDRPSPEAEYWFVVNGSDEVIESGTSLREAATLRTLDPDRIAAVQVERLEIERVPVKVMWIKLKSETSL